MTYTKVYVIILTKSAFWATFISEGDTAPTKKEMSSTATSS